MQRVKSENSLYVHHWTFSPQNSIKGVYRRDEVLGICLQLQQTVKHEYPRKDQSVWQQPFEGTVCIFLQKPDKTTSPHYITKFATYHNIAKMYEKILQSFILEPNICPYLCHITLLVNINFGEALWWLLVQCFLFQPGTKVFWDSWRNWVWEPETENFNSCWWRQVQYFTHINIYSENLWVFSFENHSHRNFKSGGSLKGFPKLNVEVNFQRYSLHT